jgi:hypothetical protein
MIVKNHNFLFAIAKKCQILKFIWGIVASSKQQTTIANITQMAQKTWWPKLILFFVEVFRSLINFASPNQEDQEAQSMKSLEYVKFGVWSMWNVELSKSLASMMKFKWHYFLFAIRKKWIVHHFENKIPFDFQCN